MSATAPPSNPAAPAPPTVSAEVSPIASVLPDRLPMPAQLDPAAALAFRTPLHEHVMSADGKAAGIITMLGLMFTVVARFGNQVAELVQGQGAMAFAGAALVLGFAVLSLSAVLQAFRTISPRFPKAPPSLAFFGDIARLPREAYLAKAEALSADEALDQILSYNHTTSLICLEKTRQLRRGMRFFEVAAACWAALVVILVARSFLPW